jgi:3-deoxy-D-manno-octulosonic-acid transferase
MGELKMLYAAADVAFVGGSMVPVGGHNILEASAAGVPVLFGPFMANFKEIAQQALQHEAAIQCQNKAAIVDAICALYAEPSDRAKLAANGTTFILQNQGVTEKTYTLLSQYF